MAKSKKAVLFLGAALIALAITGGALAIYVYNLDFGVNFRGRARLDYNWRYYFTDCPRESWEYDGEFLSFQYPKFRRKSALEDPKYYETNPLSGFDTWVRSNDALFRLYWADDIQPPPAISILLAFFTPTANVSPALLRWLLAGEESPELNYDVTLERVPLKNGFDHVLVFSCRSRLERPDYKIVVGTLHDGRIFMFPYKLNLNVTSERYWEWHVRSHITPERDAQRACVLDRFLGSLEIKK